MKSSNFSVWCVDGKVCPAATALEEWRVCNNHPCIVFHWETSAWGQCIENVSIDLNMTSLLDVTSTCPVGVQIRKVRCMKSNSGPVISKRWVNIMLITFHTCTVCYEFQLGGF